jgi:hypothetical protein
MSTQVDTVVYSTQLSNGAQIDFILYIIPNARPVYVAYRNLTFEFEDSAVKYAIVVSNWTAADEASKYIVLGVNINTNAPMLSDTDASFLNSTSEEIIELRTRINAYELRLRFLNYGVLDDVVSRLVYVDFDYLGLLASGFVRLPTTTTFRAISNITYDPDFSILFSSAGISEPGAPPSTASDAVSAGAAVGIAIAVVAVVGVVAVAFLVPAVRRKVFPFMDRHRSERESLAAAQQQQSPAQSSPALLMNRRSSNDDDDDDDFHGGRGGGGTSGRRDSSNWTKSKEPRNTPLRNV